MSSPIGPDIPSAQQFHNAVTYLGQERAKVLAIFGASETPTVGPNAHLRQYQYTAVVLYCDHLQRVKAGAPLVPEDKQPGAVSLPVGTGKSRIIAASVALYGMDSRCLVLTPNMEIKVSSSHL